MGEFRMPSLGADMTEGKLLEWLVHPGDVVHRGDIVAVVDTAKSAIDVEVFEAGEVDELLVEPGTTVKVGTPLARLRSVGAEAAGSSVPPAPAPQPPTTVVSPVVRHLAQERGVDLTHIRGTGPGGAVSRADVDAAGSPRRESSRGPSPRVAASPLARRRAAELGIDLAGIVGTGAGGAITLADVTAANRLASPPPPIPSADRSSAMREAIGALMARSKREIPHYYLQTTIDLDRASAWLTDVNAGRPVAERILPAALIFKAAAIAIRSNPDLNGFYTNGAFQRSESIHLGVAISLRGGGLAAPALLDADQLSVADLMSRLRDLVARTRSGRLRSSEIAAPTITVTNLGDQGVDLVHGVIYPPQVALLGLGRISERPWAVEGMLTVHPVVTATLAADHRVTDGHQGARYLSALDAALQHPEAL